MFFSQLQLVYLSFIFSYPYFYLELFLIVSQNYSLCETLIKSFQAKQHKQQ